MRDEVVSGVLRPVCVRLGHPVAEPGSAALEVLVDSLDEFGRHRRAAATDESQARRVTRGERLGFQ